MLFVYNSHYNIYIVIVLYRDIILANAKVPSILVLENNPSLSRLYGKVFNEAGYHVYLAPTISDARVLLTIKENFDVFLCDMQIDQNSTFDLLYEARRQHLQIIVIAGSMRFKAMSDELNSVFFLEKPVDVNILHALITRLLASSVDDCSNQP